jgi:flagellar motor switch protein FliM
VPRLVGGGDVDELFGAAGSADDQNTQRELTKCE